MISNLFRFLLLTPLLYWIYLVFFSDLGADPAKAMNHTTGEVALYFILLNLLIGILIAFKVKLPQGLRFLFMHRRFLGITSFFYLLIHLGFYLAMESFEFKAIEQLYTKNYLIAASLAFILLLTLTITSNDIAVRKLSYKNWKTLHRCVYPAAAFFTLHVMLIEKTDLIKYGAIFSLLWALLLVRFFLHVKSKI
jgi:sulfoxide reductase heme-binding subunit YedZ